jgi:CRP/FNR family transcriptional regulator
VNIVQQRGDTEHVIVTLGARDFFGDMAIFEDRPRSAGAVAVESAMLLMLSSERFRQIVLQEPAISFEIFRELCARLRRLDEEEVTVSH